MINRTNVKNWDALCHALDVAVAKVPLPSSRTLAQKRAFLVLFTVRADRKRSTDFVSLLREKVHIKQLPLTCISKGLSLP
jgi:hypothetical protein